MTARILLVVDDNPADAALLREAMSDQKLPIDFYWVEDGTKAFDFLLRRGDFADKPAVDLLLLDINMPGLTGHQVHELMRAHPQLSSLRVVVWSTSSCRQDRDRATAAGAIAYLVKPPDFDELKVLALHLNELLGATA